ncbi:uncharacterized protein J4E78_007149 [Alternaria triticimaculans]|uniref:uncharacterized protein n=1 Tax=Alternaria triticimaculans TaxID=297637 RepID=UPI0020C1E27B|nr:uncharacterized protein J4E78_007149 [Alternaria triticimaculans]KAI4654970.1 hypothetical protein J4E78_007149 [Alternaria triticimaculans]
MMLITKIELENQKIVAYQGLNFSNHPFPKLTDDVFPDTATKHAVLCSNAQFFPLAYMHPLLKKLIKTKHVEIHEVMVKIKTASRTVLILADDGTECENWPEHNISLLRITASGSRKQWYINLSGAELGLTQAFFTAADFESKHMQALCAVYEFGKCREYIWTCSTMPGWYAHTERIGLQASSRMETALLTFLQQPGNDLSNLRKRSIAGSTSWTQPLVEALSQAVHGYISNYNVGGLMSQIINEPESLTREMMRRHFDYASILGDATTVEENANCPKVTLDLAKIEEEHKGPGVKDWPIHKKACKDAQNVNLEKKLARVAEVIQQAYYDFRENTWDRPIIKVEDRDDVLVIYEGDYQKKSKNFIRFPRHLVTNDRTKKAMLCAWVCNEPMIWMHDTVLGALRGNTYKDILHHYAYSIPTGLNIKIEEVGVTLGRVPRKITIHHYPQGSSMDNWPGFYHEVIRVTSSKTRKEWVIDICGAQYGICQAFWSWDEYAKRYGAEVRKVHPVGTSKARIEEVANIAGQPSLSYGLVGKVAEHFNEVVHRWRVDGGMSLAGLLDLDNEKYKQASWELLRIMDVAVGTHMETHGYEAEFLAAQYYERRYPGKSASIACAANEAFSARIAGMVAAKH